MTSLGTNFRAGMMTNGTIQTANPHWTANSFFSVMATQDNTIVAIDLPNAIVGETTYQIIIIKAHLLKFFKSMKVWS